MNQLIEKKQVIENLLEKRKQELSQIYGAACVPGCSGDPIGCGPDYCQGPCPKACLSQCMVNPSCSTIDNPNPTPAPAPGKGLKKN